MKQLVKRIIYGGFDLGFKFLFRHLVKRQGKNTTVYLVDIDNTLADTWPSLHNYVYRNEAHRYSSLSVFLGMRNFIIDKVKNKERVIFISARSFWDYYSTQKWLLSCQIPCKELILVNSADAKIHYISYLLSRAVNVVYIDDLSYNHEHGEVLLYEEMIREIRKLPITYLGINEIEIINSANESNHPLVKKVITPV